MVAFVSAGRVASRRRQRDPHLPLQPPPPAPPRHVEEAEGRGDHHDSEPDTEALAALAQARRELEWARSCPSDRRGKEVETKAKLREAQARVGDLQPFGSRIKSTQDKLDAARSRRSDCAAQLVDLRERVAKLEVEEEEAGRKPNAWEAERQAPHTQSLG